MKIALILLAVGCLATSVRAQTNSAQSHAGSSLLPTQPITAGPIGFSAESPPIVPEMIDRHSDAVRKMLVALTNADFPGFLFQGDKHFQTIEREKFNGLARTWSQPLSSGFGMTFLGELKRGPAITTVWRIRPNDKSKDMVVMLHTNSRGSVSDIELF